MNSFATRMGERRVDLVEIEMHTFDPVYSVRQAAMLIEYAELHAEVFSKRSIKDLHNARIFCEKVLRETV